MLRRVFGHFTHKTLTFVMNAYLRPVMEYAIQAWAPWQQKDKELFQRIYHRATKSVIGLHAKTYEERIKILDLFDSNYRRIRGDLILMYNIQHSSDHPLKSLFRPGSERVTRQHRFSVEVPSSRSNCRRHFFAVRVCFVWNSLRDSIVNSLNLESFKFALDHHIRTHTICEPSHWIYTQSEQPSAISSIMHTHHISFLWFLWSNAFLTNKILNYLECIANASCSHAWCMLSTRLRAVQLDNWSNANHTAAYLLCGSWHTRGNALNDVQRARHDVGLRVFVNG